ncbi:MAG: proton extrusion protein PcxA [Cyanobacteriota bacterium]|nr:proton extrusion protein PcxA [Cyanobacteriota bacterium]
MGSSFLGKINQWISDTPFRSLEEAYTAAQAIQTLEIEHFNGKKVGSGSEHGRNVSQYFQLQLRRNLSKIEVRLAEYRTASTLTRPTPLVPSAGSDPEAAATRNGSQPNPPADPQSEVLEKLRFIDQVTSRYAARRPQSPTTPAKSAESSSQGSSADSETSLAQNNGNNGFRPSPLSSQEELAAASVKSGEPVATKTGLLPRSILRTASRIRRELDPEYEQEVVNDFRDARAKTMISIRYLVLLAFLPLLVQVMAKNFLISPLIDHYFFQQRDPTEITLSYEFEEKAMGEFAAFKEHLEFQKLLAPDNGISKEAEDNTEQILRDKAIQLVRKYGYDNLEGLKNVVADALSFGVFAWLIYIGKEEIEVLKAFLDRLIYGLSDSAKAFIIILFTDVFVGYHSPHGWEVLLSITAHHLGIPENQDAIYAFIATFPVFLDTLFKYWIFRYLNRVSPSAVATYKTMNE